MTRRIIRLARRRSGKSRHLSQSAATGAVDRPAARVPIPRVAAAVADRGNDVAPGPDLAPDHRVETMQTATGGAAVAAMVVVRSIATIDGAEVTRGGAVVAATIGGEVAGVAGAVRRIGTTMGRRVVSIAADHRPRTDIDAVAERRRIGRRAAETTVGVVRRPVTGVIRRVLTRDPNRLVARVNRLSVNATIRKSKSIRLKQKKSAWIKVRSHKTNIPKHRQVFKEIAQPSPHRCVPRRTT